MPNILKMRIEKCLILLSIITIIVFASNRNDPVIGIEFA